MTPKSQKIFNIFNPTAGRGQFPSNSRKNSTLNSSLESWQNAIFTKYLRKFGEKKEERKTNKFRHTFLARIRHVFSRKVRFLDHSWTLPNIPTFSWNFQEPQFSRKNTITSRKRSRQIRSLKA